MDILKTLWLVPLLLLTSCFEDFDPDINPKPVLCVNSTITAGQPIEVSVRRTWLYTDTDPDRKNEIADATVDITVNGQPVTPDYLARENDLIKISAFSPTFGAAEAEVRIPDKPQVTNIETEARITDKWREMLYDFGGVATAYSIDMDLRITVNDQLGIDNYYQFAIDSTFQEEEVTADERKFSVFLGYATLEVDPIFGEHIGAIDAINEAEPEGFNFFTDKQFSGKSYTLNIQLKKMRLYFEGSEEPAEIPDFGLKIMMASVSQSIYNRYLYQWHREYGYLSDLDNYGLGDPLMGYSNVSTGAGVVGGRTYTLHTINLKPAVQEAIQM